MSELPPLSKREMQVVRLLPYGLGDREIGRRLGIKLDTVKTHLRKINRRWGTTGRMQVVITSFEHGVLHLKTPAETELAELRATVQELATLLGIDHCSDGLTREALVVELRERLGLGAAAEAVTR